MQATTPTMVSVDRVGGECKQTKQRRPAGHQSSTGAWRCGHCDLCVASSDSSEVQPADLSDELRSLLLIAAQSPVSLRDLTRILQSNAQRNPAARQAAATGDWKSGDWSCTKCGDHQFASNKLCRLCGAPRPQVLRPAEEDSSSFGLGLVKRIAIDEVTGYMFHCSRYAHHRCIKSCGL